MAVIHIFLLVLLVIFVVVVEGVSRGALLVIAVLVVHVCVDLEVQGRRRLGRLELLLVK
jgi:hypothetical protein